VGWWKFDEPTAWINDCSTLTVIDSSTSANHGASCTAGTGPTSAVTGRFGSARVFTGTNSNVRIASAASTNLLAGQDFSYSVWIKRSGSTKDSFLISKGAGATRETGYALVMTSGTRPTIELSRPGESSRLQIRGDRLADTDWHLITATFQRTGQGILYVDGVQQASASIVAYNVDLTNSQPLVIGARSNGAEGFAGTIDDARLYRRVLAPAEVTQLYTGAAEPTP
jgi:hypothetical protein